MNSGSLKKSVLFPKTCVFFCHLKTYSSIYYVPSAVLGDIIIANTLRGSPYVLEMSSTSIILLIGTPAQWTQRYHHPILWKAEFTFKSLCVGKPWSYNSNQAFGLREPIAPTMDHLWGAQDRQMKHYLRQYLGGKKTRKGSKKSIFLKTCFGNLEEERLLKRYNRKEGKVRLNNDGAGWRVNYKSHHRMLNAPLICVMTAHLLLRSMHRFLPYQQEISDNTLAWTIVLNE